MNLAMKKFNSSGSPNPRPRLLDVNLWTGFNRTGKRVFVAIMRWNRRKAGCESARHRGPGLLYSRERVTQCCKSVRCVYLSIFIQTFSNNSPVGILGLVLAKNQNFSCQTYVLIPIGIEIWAFKKAVYLTRISSSSLRKNVQKLYILVLFLITLYISHGFIVSTHVTIQYGRYTSPQNITKPNVPKTMFPKTNSSWKFVMRVGKTPICLFFCFCHLIN